MLKRQMVLVVLLAGTAYLWWQSRHPSRYSEWAEDLARQADSDGSWERFPTEGADVWSFRGSGDSTWSITHRQDGLRCYQVDLHHADSLISRLRLDLTQEGTVQRLALGAAREQLVVIPAGDSARFTSRIDTSLDGWIPWEPQALPYEAIPALCDLWSSSAGGSPVTVVRIQPQTGIVIQLPGVLTRDGRGELALQAAGKLLVQVTYDTASGKASTLCYAGGHCLVRQLESEAGRVQ
jgi:hypothetical protein